MPVPPGRPPRVSLVTTFRNAEDHLAEALASIRAQRLEDWELILVDDGSHDGSPGIARRFCEDDPRCRLHTRPFQGRNAALTFAHANARGEYLGWVDADDRLHPDALATTVEIMDEAPWAVMAYSDRAEINVSGGPARPRHRIRATSLDMLRAFSTFHFRLMRRDALERAGGVGGYPIAIDYDMCLRLWEQGPVLGVDEVLYDYRHHAGQMSRSKRLSQADASASAINDAIRRRGLRDALHLRLEGSPPRFFLDSPLRGPNRGGLAAVLRRHGGRDMPRTAIVWPAQASHLDTLVGEGLFTHNIVVERVRPSLDGLVRSVRGPRCPDLLILRDWSSVCQENLALEGRLAGVLTRLRALGCRVVWCDWEDRQRTLRRSWVRAACSRVVSVDEAPPPHPLGLVPVRGRMLARRRLGLGEHAAVVVRVGDPAQPPARRDGGGVVFLELGPAPAARLDAFAAADLVVFDKSAAAPLEAWVEALATGRALAPPRRLASALDGPVPAAAPHWAEHPGPAPLTNPDELRARWRESGRRLRDALVRYDPGVFVRDHIIGRSTRAPRRSEPQDATS